MTTGQIWSEVRSVKLLEIGELKSMKLTLWRVLLLRVSLLGTDDEKVDFPETSYVY